MYKILLLIFFVILIAITSRITQINHEIESINQAKSEFLTLQYFQTYFDQYFHDKVQQWNQPQH